MRERLPDRRPSCTVEIQADLDHGPVNLLITMGFDDESLMRPREVFCASLKAGTALNAIIMDSCVLLSRLLQHGDKPEDLAHTLSHPPSLVGAVAQAVADWKP